MGQFSPSVDTMNIGRGQFPRPVYYEETGLWNHIAQNLNPGSQTCIALPPWESSILLPKPHSPNMKKKKIYIYISILWGVNEILLHNAPGMWATLKKC